jgi:hypothetical protein
LCTPAWAIRVEDIPERFYEIVPKEAIGMIPPPILEKLTYEDLWEFIQAKDCGQLYRLREVCVEDWEGLRPEQVKMLLGAMPGFPFVPARFERAAKQAYGKGIFLYLEWDIYDNGDGTADVTLRYQSRRPSGWLLFTAPGGWAGTQVGPVYSDNRLDGEDKQWGFGLLFNSEDPEEVGGHIRWRDKTVNNGNNEFYARLGVINEYRERLKGLPVVSRHRDRLASADLRYGWNNAPLVKRQQSQWGLSAGAYVSDAIEIEGDPYAPGLPRADVDPEGTAGYIGTYWESAWQDKVVSPTDGWRYYFELQQHFGDWSFNRVRLDFRKYAPAPSPFGYDEHCDPVGCDQNVASHYAPAAIALQVQADIMGAHDVPYSQEVHVYDHVYMRGYDDDAAFGTKFIGARGEYRFAIDEQHKYEGLLFTDFGWIGEDLDDLESLAAYGAGIVFTPPLLDSAKVGLHYGQAFNGESDRFGLTLGYVF